MTYLNYLVIEVLFLNFELLFCQKVTYAWEKTVFIMSGKQLYTLCLTVFLQNYLEDDNLELQRISLDKRGKVLNILSFTEDLWFHSTDYFWGLLSFSHEVANIQVWTGGALELQLEWKRSIPLEKITGLKWHYIPLRSLSCPKPILSRRHPQITRNFPTQSWQPPHSGTAFGCSFWAVLRWNLKILMVSKMEVLSLTLPPQIIAGY